MAFYGDKKVLSIRLWIHAIQCSGDVSRLLVWNSNVVSLRPILGIRVLTLWQAERHFCHLRFTGAATILSFFRSMFTSLDSIGSAVGKRPIEHAIATRELPTE